MADKIKQTVRLKGRAYRAGMEAELAQVATPEEIKSMKDRNLISGKFSKTDASKDGEQPAQTNTAAISDATPPGVGDAERAAEKAAKSDAKADKPATSTGGTAGTGDAGKTGDTGKTA